MLHSLRPRHTHLFKPFCALALACALFGANTARAEQCRPFHLSLDGQLSDFTPQPNGDVTASTSGTGHASHMGLISGAGVNVFHPPSGTTLLVDGAGAYTAANGDELFFSFEDATLDLTTGIATGTYDFEGGSGRFEDAVGTADWTVITDPNDPNAFTLTADGTICY